MPKMLPGITTVRADGAVYALKKVAIQNSPGIRIGREFLKCPPDL